MHVTLPWALFWMLAATPSAPVTLNRVPPNLELDACFRLMYELHFDTARVRIKDFQETNPDNPLGQAAEAASYLFEEFHKQGVLTSAFFLDDDRLLGGIEGKADVKRSVAFLAANLKTRNMANDRLEQSPGQPEALLARTLADGMESDYEALIEKRQIASLSLIRSAGKAANNLLKVKPDEGDAYVALGVGNYIIGCLPGYKKFFLWFGGIRGDRNLGMKQLEVAATSGRYLKPLAKVMLALACERENQFDRARTLFTELHAEFPDNPVFANELAILEKR